MKPVGSEKHFIQSTKSAYERYHSYDTKQLAKRKHSPNRPQHLLRTGFNVHPVARQTRIRVHMYFPALLLACLTDRLWFVRSALVIVPIKLQGVTTVKP